MRSLASVILAASLACAPRTSPVAATPRIAPAELAARLAEADRLASRGCYLCLKEAASAYVALLALSDDPTLASRALENYLMLALREVELRMPDSGALEAAGALRARVPGYDAYFDALDRLGRPVVAGEVTMQAIREQHDAMLAAASALEAPAHASAMRAYFYLSIAFQAIQFKDLKPAIDAILASRPDDLSLKYRMLGLQQTFSRDAARELIGMETGFGEVHFLVGQRAVVNGGLADAFRELTRARELLPDSVSILLALANVTFSYARYADALALYDRILDSPVNASELESQAQFGRARALSHLKRHDEAIQLLDALLLDDARNSPGEKYYWRAWNRLQTGQSQLAFDDATTGLNAMRNDAIYRLAGIAAFNLARLDESRAMFEGALQMNKADCDAERYLGLLDAAGRSWLPATGRFSQAAACYDAAVGEMQKELATYEKDITGLSNGLIAAKRAEIKEAETLRAQSAQNAAAAKKLLQ